MCGAALIPFPLGRSADKEGGGRKLGQDARKIQEAGWARARDRKSKPAGEPEPGARASRVKGDCCEKKRFVRLHFGAAPAESGRHS